VESVDLTARTSGLLPFWLFLILLGTWLLAILISWRGRGIRPDRVPQMLAIGALALANILFFWRPLFTAAHLPRGGGDLNSFFFTLHAYSADRLASGEIPLWNPYLHGGMPHLGNFQAGLLYPPNLIAYLFAQPFSYGALEWLAIVHYLIASLGTYLLLRSLGTGRIGAVAGGIIFAYGGFFVAHLGHYSMISAAAWVPWLVWATNRLVLGRFWWTAAGLALLVFLTASGGHQQTLLFALSGIGVWWLFLMARDAGLAIPGVGIKRGEKDGPHAGWRNVWNRSSLGSLLQFGLGIAAGILLAAPMILPSLQLAQRSVRSTLSIEQASEFSVQPVALLQLVLPTVFGSNPADYWGAFSSGEIWGYVGVTTMVVAVVGLFLRPTATRIFFAGLGIVALLYAVGPAAPVHGWFYQFVPGFDLVRAPARSYLFLNLAFAVLAGFAVSDLSERVRQHGAVWQVLIDRTLKVVAVVIGVTGLLIIPYFYTQILGVNDPPNRPVITVDNLWMFLLFLSMLAGILWLWLRSLVREAAMGLMLTAVLTLDLFSATMPFNPVEEDLVSSYREPEVTAFLQERWDETDPFRIDVQTPGLLPNFGMIDGIHVASGVYDPMQPAAYTTMHNVLSESVASSGYDLLNVRYRLVGPDAEVEQGFEPVFESGSGVRILERESALPRAWIVGEVLDIEYGVQVDALRGADFDPSTTAVIDDPPVSPDPEVSGTVEIDAYEPEHLALTVDANAQGYLIIADGAYPGWTANVDGESVPILTANYGMRAIPIDADTERVELLYQPGFVTLGMIGAGLGLLALLGMIAGPIVLSRVPSERLDSW
jgi:hypothetical protein